MPETTTPLAELRALKRAGLATADARDRVHRLLGELAEHGDALDLEAAGALLLGAAPRAQLAEAGGHRAQRIALLGSSTLDALPALLTAALLPLGVLPEIRSAGFNQWRFEILTGAPNLTDHRPELTALLLDDAAVLDGVTDPLDLDEVEARCATFPAELAGWVGACREALGDGTLVLTTVPLGPLRRDRIIDYRNKARLDAAWHRMNAALLDLADRSTVVLPADGIAAHAGTVFAAHRMRHAAGHVYAPDYLRAYAQELTRVVRAQAGRAAKCLVLDLDNTLWGGVVGDDGVAGLKLGGGYPGSAHRELQALAKDLMRQGVMLTVCSKNDEAIAREAIATHPEMLLGPDSFVAVSASWDPKPQAVREQAQRLNIGADAMVFVDDNPVERGLMRELLPQVATVELPADPADYAARLAARGDFNLLRLTEEDRGRTALYRAQEQRADLERGAASLTDYLLGLGSRLTVEPLGPLNSARISQLFGKTNQFNLTGLRYPEPETARRGADGSGAFLGARLADRFGDNGLIAALALGRDPDGAWRIENMVLSCRVFSRSVEDAVVGLLLRAARAAGAPAVRGRFAPTARNGKFAGFYPALGFTELPGTGDDGTDHQHDLRELADLPRWISVTPQDEETLRAF
ncbi:HAD-IIIC family phosphatase [Kitasatospora viridis]|uniref:D-glyceryl-ACP synthase n=1 Tax=Kitasatospora viridis TaxID=281105 RepID=A0A561UJV0_9ACTN|nr:HAD-IIIC family phosphatase [Kitasatospora viridis]TWF99639.1 D-glyceryl-ACP synthase [Kitasatospora viridis]